MKTEMENMKNEFFMCIKELWKNMIIIILCGVLGFCSGALLTIVPPPVVYRASGSISKTIVTTTQTGVPIDIYSDLLRSRRVLDEVLAAVGGADYSMSEISGMLGVSVNNSRNILTVSARHQDPEIAIKVANAATEAMVQQINETYNYPGVMVLDRANNATQSSTWSRTVLLYRASGTLIGILISCAFFVIRVLTSRKAAGIMGCTLGGELELIGVIPFAPNLRR